MPLGEVLREIALPLTDAAPLMLMVLASVMTTFGLALSRSPVLFVIGIIVLVFITSAFMKYSTRVLAARATGFDVPAADLSVFDYFRDVWGLYPWLGHVLVTAVGLALWTRFGNLAGAAYLLLVAPLVPAAVAAAAVTRRFLSLFNVPGLLRIARLMGRDYLVLLVAWVALGLLAAWLRSRAPALVAVFAGCFQTLAAFNLTGAMLFRHRRELDLPVRRETREVRDAEVEDKSLERLRRGVLDHAYGLISRGNVAGGVQHVRGYLQREEAGTAGWEWFLSEMRGWEPASARLSIARDYLGELRRHDDRGRAAAIVSECVASMPSFRPHAADAAFAAEALRECGREALAAEIGG